MNPSSFTLRMQGFVQSTIFQRAVLFAIVFSAVLLGFETSPYYMEHYGHLLKKLDAIVLGFFVFEIICKVLAKGSRPWKYLTDPWNVVDLSIVIACLVPTGSNSFAVFRLVRVLRILRIVTAFPKLQVIVTALLKSIPSMGYVVALLSVHFYMFGVLGVFLFGGNDPIHFGSLGKTFLTLFQILTLEGWADIMKIQIYGCQLYGYESFPQQCIANLAQPWAAVLYFVSFIILGTMIILNLLIGVVVNGMAETQKEQDSGDTFDPKSASGSQSSFDAKTQEKLDRLLEEVLKLKQKIR